MRVTFVQIAAIQRSSAKTTSDGKQILTLRKEYEKLINPTCSPLSLWFYTDSQLNPSVANAVDTGRKLGHDDEKIAADINVPLLTRAKKQYARLVDLNDYYIASGRDTDDAIKGFIEDANGLGKESGYTDDQIAKDIQAALRRRDERIYAYLTDPQIGSLSSGKVKPDEIQILKFRAHEIGKRLKHLPDKVDQDIQAALEVRKAKTASS